MESQNNVETPTSEVAPQKAPHYQWQPDTKFEISGKELDFLVHTTQSYLSTEKARETLAFVQCMSILERIVEGGLKSGAVIDVNKPSM